MLTGTRAEVTRPAWLDADSVAAQLERALPWCLALILACLAVPAWLRFASPAYLSCALTVSLLAIPFAMREPPETRRLFFALWAVGFAFRLALLVTLYDASVKAGGPFLGPDSLQFLRESRVMADRAFALGAHPTIVFETYDVAHYYIYAFLIRALGADLFALQLFNCGLTALAAPLAYSLGRVVVPRWALLLGLLVAVNPSLMTLSIKDLLKDPSILFAVSVAAWALVHLTEPPRVSSRIAYVAAAAVALAYLHMDRFYVAAYLEIAAVVTAAVVFWRDRLHVRAGVVVPILLAFLIAEAGPMALGWRSSPMILYEQVRYVSRTPAMLQADDGMTQRALRSRAALEAAAASARAALEAAAASAPAGDRHDAQVLPQTEGTALRSASLGVSVVKRLFGPFVWVMPAEWTLRELLRGDYMLYPGTLAWYFVMPLAFIGLVSTAWHVLSGREHRPLMIALTTFCLLYFTQYVAINLSFRQRDVMFPFAALLACVGIPVLAASEWWRRLAVVYLLGLGAFACVHLVVRSMFA